MPLLFVTLIWLLIVVGWVMNIVKFVVELDGGVTAMFIARIVGVIVAPLGAVLGYL